MRGRKLSGRRLALTLWRAPCQPLVDVLRWMLGCRWVRLTCQRRWASLGASTNGRGCGRRPMVWQGALRWMSAFCRVVLTCKRWSATCQPLAASTNGGDCPAMVWWHAPLFCRHLGPLALSEQQAIHHRCQSGPFSVGPFWVGPVRLGLCHLLGLRIACRRIGNLKMMTRNFTHWGKDRWT